MVLPYINMNPPRVYTCSPSWTPLPPPSKLFVIWHRLWKWPQSFTVLWSIIYLCIVTLWPLPSQGRFFFFLTISLNLHWLCDFLWQINVVEITGFQFQLESPTGLSYDFFVLSGAPTSVYSASWLEGGQLYASEMRQLSCPRCWSHVWERAQTTSTKPLNLTVPTAAD